MSNRTNGLLESVTTGVGKQTDAVQVEDLLLYMSIAADHDDEAQM